MAAFENVCDIFINGLVAHKITTAYLTNNIMNIYFTMILSSLSYWWLLTEREKESPFLFAHLSGVSKETFDELFGHDF